MLTMLTLGLAELSNVMTTEQREQEDTLSRGRGLLTHSTNEVLQVLVGGAVSLDFSPEESRTSSGGAENQQPHVF